MAKSPKRRSSSSVVFQPPERPRKRSLTVPLLWLGAAALIGYPVVRDLTADRMLRNRYSDVYSCQCDYGNLCVQQDGQWYGPWYARDAKDRQPGDPGSGQCRSGTSRGGHGGGYYGRYGYGNALSTYRPPAAVETGYRGGFGSTGRSFSVRA